MDEAERAANYERLRQGRDLVRKTALLLSSGQPVEDLFDRLAALLAEFVDASIVLVAIGTGSEARIAYVNQDGAGGRPDDGAIRAGSATESVLRGGQLKLYATRGEWPSQSALAIEGRTLHLPESAIFVPILFGGTPVGVLSVQSRRRDAYDAEDAALLETCALYLGARIHDGQQREQSAQLERLASTDPLTGLANRRAFDTAVVREWRRCTRSGDPLSIALLDVDYFKAFNDAYGHVAGDTCLRQIGQAIAHCLKRPGDSIARYGGEEFALVLPETDASGAVALCESMCEAVRALGIPHQGSSLGFVTVSLGVYATVPQSGDDPQGAVLLADGLLYRAKGAGRNRVAADGYASQAPTAAVRTVAHHNLPAPRSSFVGRGADVATIGEGLRRGRLVTVAGTPGVGKTRVALEVARDRLESFPDGVWFVDLAPIADPALVAGTAAIAIGIDIGASGIDPAVALAERLKPQRLLLVFDNCEHVVAEAARVIDRLLTSCEHVVVLATSREPLRIAGESVHRLSSLEQSSAVELFYARARDADRRFELTGADAEAISEVCRRLDGIALAIELAASRVRSFSPVRILELIDDRFRLLDDGRRTEIPRHQTLTSLIDWSHALLSERERIVFRRLSIFAGSFSIEAADAVAIEGEDRWAAVDTLSAQDDKSMVVQAEAERYRLLDSIAEYARTKLAQSDESERIAGAHARFLARESQRMAATHGDLPEELWLARHEPDLDNIRAALEWSQVHDVDTAARIIGSLHMFWNLAGLDVEARRRSEAVLAALGEDASRPEYMRVWIAVGWAAHRMFDTRRGLEAGEVALEMARKGNDRLGLAEALATVGMSHHRFGTDPARAHAALKESLEAYRAVGKPLRVVYAIIDYASSLVRSGNLEEARGYLAEAADLARASNWARALRNAEANLAEVVFVLGGVEEACALGRRCVEMYRSGHSNLELANALANLASYLSIAGRAAEAVDAGREAMVHAKPYVAEAHIAVAAQALALCAARDGNARTAARLMGFVDAVYERRGAQREPTEAIVRRGIVEALDALGDAVAFQDEIRRGRELDLDGGYRLGMNTHSTFES